MSKLYLTIKIFCLFSLSTLFLSLTFLALTINESILRIETDLHETLSFTRTRIESIENNTFNTIASIEKNMITQIEKTRNQTLKRADHILNEVSSLNTEGKDVLKETKNVIAEANKTIVALNINMDCENNSFCWPNLMQDTMISTRNAALDVSTMVNTINTSMPSFVQDFSSISKNFTLMTSEMRDSLPTFTKNSNEIAENINRLTKPKWYDRLFGYAANGSLIFFNINRGRIVSQTTQAVSGK